MNIELIQGDCLIESDKIESGSVDLILTDLPYGTVKNAKFYDYCGGVQWDNVIDTDKIMQIANRLLRRNGKMLLFAQDPFSTELKNKAIANLPYNYSMIWEKDNFANPLISAKAPVNYYEDILVFSKGNHGDFGSDNTYREYLNTERKKSKLTLDQMCGVCDLNTKGHGGAAYHWCSSKQPQLIPEKHYLTLRKVTGNFLKDYFELKEIHKKSFEKDMVIFNLWEGKKYKSNILKYKWEKNDFANALIAKKAPVSYFEDIIVFSKKHEFEGLHPLRPYFKEVFEYIGHTKKTILEQVGQRADHVFRFNSSQFDLCTIETYEALIYFYCIDKMDGFKTYAELRDIDKKYDSTFNSTFNLWEGKKYKSNILKYKKDYDGYHPTQKPVLLLEDLIKTFSNENNLVVDLTMGSGSTAIACLNTNRNFIGIELDENYFNISKKRVEEKRKEKDLQAGTLFGNEM